MTKRVLIQRDYQNMSRGEFIYEYQLIMFETLGISDAVKVEYAVFWDSKSI